MITALNLCSKTLASFLELGTIRALVAVSSVLILMLFLGFGLSNSDQFVLYVLTFESLSSSEYQPRVVSTQNTNVMN